MNGRLLGAPSHPSAGALVVDSSKTMLGELRKHRAPVPWKSPGMTEKALGRTLGTPVLLLPVSWNHVPYSQPTRVPVVTSVSKKRQRAFVACHDSTVKLNLQFHQPRQNTDPQDNNLC